MKNKPTIITVYTRAGPLSDMYVPRRERVEPFIKEVRKGNRVVVALMMLIALPALVSESATLAYFNDVEGSTGNTFAAGPLAITVTADHTEATLADGGAGEPFTFTVSPITESLPLLYLATASTTAGSAFCEAIVAAGGEPLPYDGAAHALTTTPIKVFDPWTLTLSLPTDALGVTDGDTCKLDVVFDAYQEGGAVGTEYHDSHTITLTLTANVPEAIVTTTVVSQNALIQTETSEGAESTESPDGNNGGGNDNKDKKDKEKQDEQATSTPTTTESVVPDEEPTEVPIDLPPLEEGTNTPPVEPPEPPPEEPDLTDASTTDETLPEAQTPPDTSLEPPPTTE